MACAGQPGADSQAEPAGSLDDNAPEPGSKRNRGPCRICYEYEDEGEIIAPCLCKGSHRWIHRHCLDRWRTSGYQRALTNCRECGFQYHLSLCREDGKGMNEGQHRLLQKIGTQSLATFCLLQALILILGMCIRLLDTGEGLVKVFHLPQEPGGEKIGDFWHALKYHKTTYYLAGLIALLFIAGIVGTVYSCCTSRGRREFDMGGGHFQSGHGSFFDIWACNMCCEDCGNACSHSCACNQHCCDPSSLLDIGGIGECGDCLLLGVVVALVLFVLVGIFMAVVAIVTAIMRFGTQWARLAQMRELAKEYVVEDLADPDEGTIAEEKQQVMTAAKHPPERPDVDQVQHQLAHDLSLVFGTDPASSGAANNGVRGPDYGSVV